MKKPKPSLTGAIRGGAYSVVISAMVLAILVALNVAVSALPSGATEYDISASKLYSVTSNTKSVVGRAHGRRHDILDSPGRPGGRRHRKAARAL